ncbi:pacearchaeosortase [Candidatus Woesearchaeota archaeon]|nr:pacearchaeosortase [Candidatus Woesearchaeota archaeon]
MKYQYQLLFRLILLFAVPLSLFYFIFTPLTIYPSYFLLKLSGFAPQFTSSTVLAFKELAIKFVPACIAGSAYYLLYILIMLTKDLSIMQSLKLFIYGSLLILSVNLIRIYIIVFVLIKYGLNYFDMIHLFFWTFVASTYVALIWIFLTRKMKIKSIPAYSDVMYLYKKIKKNI